MKRIVAAVLAAVMVCAMGMGLAACSDASPKAASNTSAVAAWGSLGLADGTYTIDVALEGGSGKASVASPAKLAAKDGAATATIAWSSPYYDYMIVDGEKYSPQIEDGHSVFEIPVTAFDADMEVKADTTAMSVPHEIDYTLHFDSKSIQEQQ